MAETVLPRAYPVSQINNYIREYIAEDEFLADVLVQGELTSFKRHSSGHIYFTLAEGGCVLSGAMFRAQAESLQFMPEQGLEIVVWGAVAFYERDGRLQLYARAFFPLGAGAAGTALAQLKQRLAAEGLFGEERKQRLPLLPRSLGVITAAGSAAWADIQRVALSRWPGLAITLYPATVQGAEAPASIAAALAKADKAAHGVLILGRGGGASEDLAAFNTETVARAVAATRTPLIAAVGHEIDWTLADLAADLRAATPSHAASLAVPQAEELLARLKEQQRRLDQALALRLELCRQQLQRARQLLTQSAGAELQQRWQQLSILTSRLEALSPLATLARGYAVCRNQAGQSLVQSSQAQPGEILSVLLAEGSLSCEVREIELAKNR